MVQDDEAQPFEEAFVTKVGCVRRDSCYITRMDTAELKVLYVNCACCHKALGYLMTDGWHWRTSPARLVNRRRLITKSSDSTSLMKMSAPFDDFRMRSVERHLGEVEMYLWEYPYACDSDECCTGLGSEWEMPDGREARWSQMPTGTMIQ